MKYELTEEQKKYLYREGRLAALIQQSNYEKMKNEGFIAISTRSYSPLNENTEI